VTSPRKLCLGKPLRALLGEAEEGSAWVHVDHHAVRPQPLDAGAIVVRPSAFAKKDDVDLAEIDPPVRTCFGRVGDFQQSPSLTSRRSGKTSGFGVGLKRPSPGSNASVLEWRVGLGSAFAVVVVGGGGFQHERLQPCQSL
jgi:hypothetical protein